MHAQLPDFIATHRNYLVQVGIRRGLQYTDAEDAVHDLYAKLSRGCEAPVADEQGNVRAWLAVHLELEPDMLVTVDDPARMLELRWLGELLRSAGAYYESVLPDDGEKLSGRARTALCRLKKKLQPLFAHYKS